MTWQTPARLAVSGGGQGWQQAAGVMLYASSQEVGELSTLQELSIDWPRRSPACDEQCASLSTAGAAAAAADEVEVTGVVIRQFGPMIPGVRCQVGAAVWLTAACWAGRYLLYAQPSQYQPT
jgi:hypothetical protein